MAAEIDGVGIGRTVDHRRRVEKVVEHVEGEGQHGACDALLHLDVCMYICMHVHVHMHACMYVRTYVCMHVCMHACMYACMHGAYDTLLHLKRRRLSTVVCTYVHMYACMYVCMYICM